MARNYWLVKSEPESYSWTTFVKEGRTAWTGVRNYQARNNLRGMRSGDWACFYHSGDAKEIVGVARVSKDAFPDPTAKEGDWVAVELEPVTPLREAVTLQVVKENPKFRDMLLVKNSRLSVMPLTEAEFSEILRISKTSVAKS